MNCQHFLPQITRRREWKRIKCSGPGGAGQWSLAKNQFANSVIPRCNWQGRHATDARQWDAVVAAIARRAECKAPFRRRRSPGVIMAWAGSGEWAGDIRLTPVCKDDCRPGWNSSQPDSAEQLCSDSRGRRLIWVWCRAGHLPGDLTPGRDSILVGSTCRIARGRCAATGGRVTLRLEWDGEC